MKVVNAGSVYLKGDDLGILFLLNQNDRYRYISEIDKINNSCAFTFDIYNYSIQTTQSEVNKNIPVEELRIAIASHNIMMPLFSDADGNNLYAFDNINLEVSIEDWWRQVHAFLIEASRYNIETIKSRIEKEMSLKEPGYKESVLENIKIINILEDAIPSSIVDLESFISDNKSTSAINNTNSASINMPDANIQIYVKPISIMFHKKSVKRYGFEVVKDNSSIHIYFGDKTQMMIYLMVLIRCHLGKPLYLHELYSNSQGFRSPYNKKQTKKWMHKVFSALYGKIAEFDEWLTPNQKTISGDGRIEVVKKIRNGHDYHHAKSRINTQLKKTLTCDWAVAYNELFIDSIKDDDGYSLYTIKCKPENIILDETAQKLSEDFKNIYNL